MSPRSNFEDKDRSDPVLPDEMVLHLARRHGAAAQFVDAVDESGGEARVYICGEVVIKTQRPQRRRARTSLEKEAFILEQLNVQGVSFVPRVMGYGREGDVEYEVLTRMRGIALRTRGSTLWGGSGSCLRPAPLFARSMTSTRRHWSVRT
jgi:hygromycin-B 7''-O-kinase